MRVRMKFVTAGFNQRLDANKNDLAKTSDDF